MKLQCHLINRRLPSERGRRQQGSLSHSHFVPVISLHLTTWAYLKTLKTTSVKAEIAVAAEGICALSYARRWEITVLTHYVF